jgi:tight adherence protein B
MFLWVIFGVVLIVCFGIVLYVMKATTAEKAVMRQLATIAATREVRAAAGTILKEQGLSPNPWVHELLSQTPKSAIILDLIQQAGADWWVSSVIQSSIALAFAGALISAFWTGSFSLILLSALAAGFLPFAYLLLLRYRRLQACDALLPEAVELMARAMRAGHTLTSALEIVSNDIAQPLASEFRTVFEEQSFGLPLRDALTNLLRRVPGDDLRFLTTALLIQKETGGNLTQILDTTSSVMRQRKRMKGQVRIYTAQARATGWVVASLPALLFLVFEFLKPDYEQLLLTDPIGSKVLYVGVFFWLIGAFIIKKIMTIKV